MTRSCTYCGQHHSTTANPLVDTRFGFVHDECLADLQNSI